jgi:hypothetical protein
MAIKKVFTVIAIWILMILICASIGELAVASDGGAVSADFLNIGAGSRAAGMGEAYTSVVNDATAGYWNPAGLSGIDSWQIYLSHFSWYQDISYNNLAAARPINNKAVFAIGITYVGYGDIEGYDINGNPTGEVASTYNLAAGMSLGYKIQSDFSAGITAKYIMVSLAGNASRAIAADFGIKYSISNFTFGLALANIGQKMKFDRTEEKLPANIRFGMSIDALGSSLLGSFEIEKTLQGGLIFKNGYEYGFGNYFLRTGYSYFNDQDGREMARGLSFGAGAKLGHTRFDYTYTPDQRTSSDGLHKFSVLIDIKK